MVVVCKKWQDFIEYTINEKQTSSFKFFPRETKFTLQKKKEKSEEDIIAKREKHKLNLRLKQLRVVPGVCFFNKDFIFATLVSKCMNTN